MWGNPILSNLLKKYREKIINYWLRKVNIDTINWEKRFDRPDDHKWCNIPWLADFNMGQYGLSSNCVLRHLSRPSNSFAETFTAWKVSVFGVFLVRIFPHSDWMRRDTEYLSVFIPIAGKYGTEKLRKRSHFKQRLVSQFNDYSHFFF